MPQDLGRYPTGAEVIDANRNGVIGRGVERVDGVAKVTGAARYAYEVREAGEAAYGVAVASRFGKGRVVCGDLDAIRALPGVLLAWSAKETPDQAPFGLNTEAAAFGALAASKPVMASDETRYFGDVAAFVVAETFEEARSAAAALAAALTYEDHEGVYDFAAAAERPPEPDLAHAQIEGDFESAFAGAPARVDAVYTTPIQNHAPMEPHASLAVWEADALTLYTSTQLLKVAQQCLAETLRVPKDKVRVVSRYVGGGFGGKLHQLPDAILAALAARALSRPVKVALTRQQVFQTTTHRTATTQRVRLGADRQGRLIALAHESLGHHARFHPFNEHPGSVSKSLYAAAHRRVVDLTVPLDLPMADAVRAPGEAVGMLAIECAMDELAEALGLDPIELRIRNEPDVDPDTGKPFGSRSLVACMRDGAQRFGWSRRGRPGSKRDGDWLVGLGMAASMRANYLLAARASIRINVDGRAVVRQAMTDIGTGTYTILAQIAAEVLGVSVHDVVVEIGDSAFPPAPGSGGSFGAASAGSAVLDAGMNLRRELAVLAIGDPASPLYGAKPELAQFAGGRLFVGNRSEALRDLVRRCAPEGLEAGGSLTPSPGYNDVSQHAHGAHFAEVGVHRVTGEVRLRRMLGVFAAGRILNAQTARSQAVGGMIWGVGGALTEENHVDERYGSFIAQDLAAYHIPAHADIVDLDAVFIAERDDHGNPMRIKGVGELGICGAGAAVANAVFNACGVRVRDYPITLDKILAAGRLAD